jgi:drug/metabolite transporter (DMT)-like permease
MKARKPGTALWTLIFSQLIIGATYLVAKVGLREIPPLALGCLRFLLAAAVFTLLLKQRGKLRLPAREDRRTFFWLALLAVPLNQGLFLYGIQLTLAAHGALFYSTTPIMVLVLSAIWLKERMTPLKIIGTALGFAGVLSILFDDGIRLSGNTLHGDLLLIGAVTTWALYTIISKRLLSRYSALEVTGFSLTLGSLLFLPVGIPAVIAFDHSRVTVTGIGSLLYLALMTSVFGYLVWSWALSKLEASKVAIVSNLQPIVAALLGWIFLGEGITPRFVVGALAVMMGVAITERG